MIDAHSKDRQHPWKESPGSGSRRRSRGKILSIHSFFDGKGEFHRPDDVITIYTGLRRWWRDASWRSWLILSLLMGIILGFIIGRSGQG